MRPTRVAVSGARLCCSRIWAAHLSSVFCDANMTARSFEGDIAEVAVYDAAPSASRVATHFHAAGR
jgi:hypothetical protein